MMTKKTFHQICLLLVCIYSSWSQTVFTENMGSPIATTNIASNVFENNTSLSYSNGGQSNSADVRVTNASTGYSGASSGGNIFFSSTSGAYGFSIEGINASNYSSLTLQFGYRKEAATTHASFSVDYWNGSTWVILANSETDLFNESASASAKWYLSKVLTLPVEAQINGLKIRFVKTGTTAIRIDDVLLTANETPTDIPSSSSDIVFNSSSSTSSNTNINYLNYQADVITSTANSVGVMGFYLRDGGVSLNDTDSLATELTEITFNVTNSNNIRSARLFVGNSPRGVSVPVNGASTITFTGLTNIIAADDEQLAINLRVTFNEAVTDNEQMQFTISSATANSTGSQFSMANAGGASSSISGDINRIEVIASKLKFTQQPPETLVTDFNMQPAAIVSALDEFGNIDLDFDSIVTITSSGTLKDNQILTASSGIAVFSNIIHSTPGTGIFLTANSAGLYSSTSNPFEIETSTIYHLINNLPGEILTSYFQNTTCQNDTCTNLVINGDFEEYMSLPTNGNQIEKACGWSGYHTPDYFHSASPNPYYSIPCNFKGGESSNNNQGNGYAGLFINNIGSEIMVSKLALPLVQGVKYQLSFDVSLAEGNSSFSKSVQAYLSQNLVTVESGSLFPVANPQMVFSKLTTSTVSNGWETLTFNFTADGEEEYIYFGNFLNMVSLPNPIAINPNCTYNNDSNFILPIFQPSYYYLDNISLVPIADLNLPDTICNTTSLPNLSSFLSNAPTNGIFTGTGIVENSGNYSFDATVAGVGTHTISYTYNDSGCLPITISDDITVATSGIVAEFDFSTNIVLCNNSTPPILQTTSNNGITGTWNPSTISTTLSDFYTFTPDSGQCSSPKLINVTINNVIDAVDDDFSLTPIITLINETTISVFANDTINGNTLADSSVSLSASIISITPSIDPMPTIDDNGIIAFPIETPVGIYTIEYKISDNTCMSNFDTATVTVAVASSITNCLKIHLGQFCYNATQSQTTPLTVFNQVDDTCDFAMIGNVFCNSTNVTIELETPLLYGCTMNANGTITIPAGTMPFFGENYYRLRSVQYPGLVSELFRVNYGITDKVQPAAPIIYLHTGSAPYEVYINNSVDVLTTPVNSRINPNTDGSCNLINALVGPSTQSNTVTITETTTPQNPYYQITPQGFIQFRLPYSSSNPPPVPILPSQSYILTYTMCINNTAPLLFCNNSTVVIYYYYGSNSREMQHTTKENNLVVYPNPSTDGRFTLVFDEKSTNGTVEVYNLLGQKVAQDTIQNATEHQLNMPIAAGTYILRFNNGSEQVIKRVIIK